MKQCWKTGPDHLKSCQLAFTSKLQMLLFRRYVWFLWSSLDYFYHIFNEKTKTNTNLILLKTSSLFKESSLKSNPVCCDLKSHFDLLLV